MRSICLEIAAEVTHCHCMMPQGDCANPVVYVVRYGFPFLQDKLNGGVVICGCSVSVAERALVDRKKGSFQIKADVRKTSGHCLVHLNLVGRT